MHTAYTMKCNVIVKPKLYEIRINANEYTATIQEKGSPGLFQLTKAALTSEKTYEENENECVRAAVEMGFVKESDVVIVDWY